VLEGARPLGGSDVRKPVDLMAQAEVDRGKEVQTGVGVVELAEPRPIGRFDRIDWEVHAEVGKVNLAEEGAPRSAVAVV
jgi:hypothetical protein